MGWFSPIKGGYPSLGQIDKTLPVAGTSNTGIERGTIIQVTSDAVNADGAFKIAGAVGETVVESLLYISLQDYDDEQAGMAGTIPFDGNVPSITGAGGITIPGVTAGVPTITGLALSMEGEYETSMFDANSLASAQIGDGLKVSSGVFAKAGTGDTVVAYLTSTPTNRWVNNAVAKNRNPNDPKHTAVRQGKNVPVIRFRTK